MDNITLTELKSLTTSQARELCHKLNVEIPPEADLEYMRSNLRLLKLKQVAHDQELSLTQDSVPRHSGFSSSAEWKVSGNHHYEDIDYSTTLNVASPGKQTVSDGNSDTGHSCEPPYYSSVPAEINIRPHNMAERLPCFQPDVFGGKPSENVKEFFSRYEKVALANGWNDERKKQLLSFYVSGVAKSVLENIEREKGHNLTWEIAKQSLISSFSYVQNSQILEMELNNRRQTPGEPTVDYVTDVIRLCSLIDSTMQESRVCGHVLKGINPATLQMIAMLDNSTKEKLFENMEKYEQSSILMRHRLGVDTPSANVLPTNHVHADLNNKIDQLTQLVNQLKFDSQQDRHRPQSRESHYHQDSPSEGPSGSRYPRGRYNNDTRERRSSRSRDRYNYDRRPRSIDRRDYRSPGPSFSRTPSRVRFSDNTRQSFPETSNSRFRDNYRDSSNKPSQPCRHCNRWGHWSQSCWSLKSKN